MLKVLITLKITMISILVIILLSILTYKVLRKKGIVLEDNFLEQLKTKIKNKFKWFNIFQFYFTIIILIAIPFFVTIHSCIPNNWFDEEKNTQSTVITTTSSSTSTQLVISSQTNTTDFDAILQPTTSTLELPQTTSTTITTKLPTTSTTSMAQNTLVPTTTPATTKTPSTTTSTTTTTKTTTTTSPKPSIAFSVSASYTKIPYSITDLNVIIKAVTSIDAQEVTVSSSISDKIYGPYPMHQEHSGDMKNWTFNASFYVQGVHTITVTARSLSGETVTDSISITIP